MWPPGPWRSAKAVEISLSVNDCESSVHVLRTFYGLKYAAFVFASVNASGISANGEKSNRTWLLNRSTHPCSAATATCYHVLSCGCIKKSVFYILPQSTGMSTFALDDRASGWASNAPHFRRVSRSKAFPKQGGIFLSRWWSGSFGEVTACVVLRWCVPSLEPPLSHSTCFTAAFPLWPLRRRMRTIWVWSMPLRTFVVSA